MSTFLMEEIGAAIDGMLAENHLAEAIEYIKVMREHEKTLFHSYGPISKLVYSYYFSDEKDFLDRLARLKIVEALDGGLLIMISKHYAGSFKKDQKLIVRSITSVEDRKRLLEDRGLTEEDRLEAEQASATDYVVFLELSSLFGDASSKNLSYKAAKIAIRDMVNDYLSGKQPE